MKIEVDEHERGVLVELLEELLGDLRDEIYRAESHEFKEKLRARKEVVSGLPEKLRQPAAVEAGGSPTTLRDVTSYPFD